MELKKNAILTYLLLRNKSNGHHTWPRMAWAEPASFIMMAADAWDNADPCHR